MGLLTVTVVHDDLLMLTVSGRVLPHTSLAIVTTG
jgi:hypothetical protein